jgi:2-polyprenyl-3-methyl-5-hydroxy-6-metoxy-1,4-benzoquinol methylase
MPVTGPGRHLDYGCGPGSYMLFAKSCGWDTVGVEYSEKSAQAARDRGLAVMLESELHAASDEQFDLVTMNHSLEHVVDPLGVVTLLARKLRPGGHLFVEVPSINPLEFRLFGRYFAMGRLCTCRCSVTGRCNGWRVKRGSISCASGTIPGWWGILRTVS